MRVAKLLLLSCAMCMALVIPFSGADKTGDGATHQLATIGQARWVLVIADPGNAAAVRIGPASTSSTVGARMAAGGGFLLPPIPGDPRQPVDSNNFYDLSAIYYFASSGDKISFVWGY